MSGTSWPYWVAGAVGAALIGIAASDRYRPNKRRPKWEEEYEDAASAPDDPMQDELAKIDDRNAYSDYRLVTKAVEAGWPEKLAWDMLWMLRRIDMGYGSKRSKAAMRGWLPAAKDFASGEEYFEDPQAVSYWISGHNEMPKNFGQVAENISPDIFSEPHSRKKDRHPSMVRGAYYFEVDADVKDIAKMIGAGVEDILKTVKSGKNVIVLGRDGETLFRAAKRDPRVRRASRKNRVYVRYLLAPRVLTSERLEGNDYSKYDSYFRRVIGRDGAVFYDTGYEGTIPKWLSENGYPVLGIRLLSAHPSAESYQIPMPRMRSAARDVVLGIEHGPTRLAKMGREPSEAWRYSGESDSYYTMLRDIYNELGLKMPKKVYRPNRRRR